MKGNVRYKTQPMKATTLLLTALLLGGCSYTNVGSLTMASTRNVDASKTYVLLARNVEAKVNEDANALQAAIDQAVASRPGGEYMMNVAISVNGDGKRVKITGDVWGVAGAEGVAPAAVTGAATDLKVGDHVAFKYMGHMLTGTIIGLQTEKAMVQYDWTTNKGVEQKMRAVWFDELTKVAQ